MQKQDPVLVWLDMEMTGLDPATCAIVQMAFILTNTELEPLAPPLELTVWQPPAVLEAMTPFVREMHQKSGLLAAVRESKISLEEAERTAMTLITQHAAYRTAYLCGNSVWQDRRFLAQHMPALESYLHYRLIDVSTVKQLGDWWFGTKYNKPNANKHTALHDIEQSLEELRYYRRKIFATALPPAG